MKFRVGKVVFAGSRGEAANVVAARAPAGTHVMFSTATAGYGGTATAGDGGTATAGYGGTATAGYGGTISIEYWDEKRGRYRRAIAEVGEDGIEPNTAYVLDVADGRRVFKKKES